MAYSIREISTYSPWLNTLYTIARRTIREETIRGKGEHKRVVVARAPRTDNKIFPYGNQSFALRAETEKGERRLTITQVKFPAEMERESLYFTLRAALGNKDLPPKIDVQTLQLILGTNGWHTASGADTLSIDEQSLLTDTLKLAVVSRYTAQSETNLLGVMRP